MSLAVGGARCTYLAASLAWNSSYTGDAYRIDSAGEMGDPCGRPLMGSLMQLPRSADGPPRIVKKLNPGKRGNLDATKWVMEAILRNLLIRDSDGGDM